MIKLNHEKTSLTKWLGLGFLIFCASTLSLGVFAQSTPLSERPANVRSSDALVYHGKLVRPDGKVVSGSLSVQIDIYSPEPSVCLLWSETQTLTAQNGAFSLELGYSENRRSGPDAGAAVSWRDVFLNNPGLTISSATCADGTSYTPTASDDRLMKATFNDAGSVVTAELIPIKSVPFAMQAREIGGYGINNIVKVSGAGSSSIVLSPDELARLKTFSEAAPSSLGTTNQVLGMNAAGNGLEYKSITAGSNVTINHTVGGIEINATGGGGGGGTVESVSVAGLPLSVGGTTASPSISIAQAGSGVDGYLSAADWALFNSKQPAGAYLTSISSADVTGALGFTPLQTINILDIKSTQGANPAWFNVSGACSAGQNLGYNSVTDRLECGGFTLTSAQVTAALGFTPASSVGAGTVTSVSSANADISVANGTTTPSLTLNSGTAGGVGDANKIAKLDGAGVLAANMIPNLNASKINAGTLGVDRGGTGAGTFTTNGVLFGNGTSALGVTAAGSAGQILRSGGGSAPSWSTATYPAMGGTIGTMLRSDGTNFVNTTASYPSTTSQYGLLYSSANNVIGEIGTANSAVLMTSGIGAPSWSVGTNNRVLRSNGSSVSFDQVNLTSDVTGTLPVANGGTGATSLPGTFVLNGGQAGAVTLGPSDANSLTMNTAGSPRVTVTSSGNVGVGTSSPGAKLSFGSLIDASHTSIGAIRLYESGLNVYGMGVTSGIFNITSRSDFSFYTGSNGVGQAERIRIKENGNVGIGTSTPGAKLHIQSDSGTSNTLLSGASLEIQRNEASTPSNGGHIDFKKNSAEDFRARIYFDDSVDSSNGALGFAVNSDGASFYSRLLISGTGNVGVGTTSPTEMLEVSGKIKGSHFYSGVASPNPGAGTESGALLADGYISAYRPSNSAAYFGRGNDGPIVGFYVAGTQEGTISISGGTVTYNAFTGSHFATTKEHLQRGVLVELRDNPLSRPGSREPVYQVGIARNKNSKRVLGAFLGLLEPQQSHSLSNPYQIAAVGNGELWVIETERDILPGDNLIASSVYGHAQLDDSTEEVSHIVAKAAEKVDWSKETANEQGVKRKLISVLFSVFDVRNEFKRNSSLSKEVEGIRAENKAMRKWICNQDSSAPFCE